MFANLYNILSCVFRLLFNSIRVHFENVNTFFARRRTERSRSFRLLSVYDHRWPCLCGSATGAPPPKWAPPPEYPEVRRTFRHCGAARSPRYGRRHAAKRLPPPTSWPVRQQSEAGAEAVVAADGTRLQQPPTLTSRPQTERCRRRTGRRQFAGGVAACRPVTCLRYMSTK